jgi:superfamily II DNA or RNA helicase
MLTVDKGILILATGTGKTVIYSLYIQKCKGRYLIVVPTTTLVTQTVIKCREILGQDFKVCEYKTDIELPCRKSCKDLVVVGTYQNSHNIRSVEDIDCIFFDECHSTVILKPNRDKQKNKIELSRFQKLLDYPCKKKFFGTATEKNITSQTEKPISMDDQKIYGPVLYKYTITDAVSEGYLSDYTFDLIGAADKKQACIGYIKSRFKSLIFCSNLESVRQLYSTLYEALKTSTVKVYKLTEKDSVETVTKLFSECKSQSVLVSCRKINIGYDEPQIDTVIHYDISTSSIMTIQRNGRALRPSPDKVMAKIVFLCDLSGDSESQKEQIKKLEAPISYLQLYDSRLRDRIAKEVSKPSGVYKSINVKLEDGLEQGLEQVKIYDRFWNLLTGSSITYNQCKDLVKRANPPVVSIREYRALCKSEPKLPLNPEETFTGEFKGWVDYLSVDTSQYYSEKECRDLIRKCYDQFSDIPELSKRCKALRKTDPKFPPPDMWVHVYGLSSLEVIFSNKGSTPNLSLGHDIDSLLK